MRTALRTLTATFESIGSDPADAPDTALQKRLLIGLAGLVSALAVFWGLAYIALDEPLAGSIPLSYAVLSSSSIVVFAITKRNILFRASQLALIVLLPFILMVTLGGFVNSSAVILWSLLGPLGALLFLRAAAGCMRGRRGGTSGRP